jgi:hypothetical protein
MKHIFCQVVKRLLEFCKRKTHSFQINEVEIRLTKLELKEKTSQSNVYTSNANTITSINKSEDDVSSMLESLSLFSNLNYESLAKFVRSKRILVPIDKTDFNLLTK